MTDDELPDLHTWRVPPPPALDAGDLVLRALTPATAPARRPRLRWIIGSIVLANAAIAVLLVILLARPSAPRQAVVVAPAGDPAMDARVHELLARLADEQAQLEKTLAQIAAQRALVQELSDKVARCEHDRTVAKPPGPAPSPSPAPAPVVVPGPAPAPAPVVREADTSCDEVSCVLNNYDTGCCDKYKKTAVPPPPPGLPESLDRAAISRGVNSAKDGVARCATTAPAKGTVKVHVIVGANGLVTNVTIAQTPDPALGACVAAAMQRGVFPRTKQGGSFTYPFVF
ncbi:MAG: hypothetical protein JO257_28420 [Deltaproteobacteria bacterium]|nr:hypothetical protein [Deltaproteobacteria bacterium]